MAKTRYKKQKPVIPPKPSELIRDEVTQLISYVNEELQHIIETCEGIDISAKSNYIGNKLNDIEACFEKLEKQHDDLEEKVTELGEEAVEIKDKIERLEEYSDGLTDVNTMVGELRYKTNNFLDADLLDLFTECLVEIKPADLHTHLQTILKTKNSSNAECSVDDIL